MRSITIFAAFLACCKSGPQLPGVLFRLSRKGRCGKCQGTTRWLLTTVAVVSPEAAGPTQPITTIGSRGAAGQSCSSCDGACDRNSRGVALPQLLIVARSNTPNPKDNSEAALPGIGRMNDQSEHHLIGVPLIFPVPFLFHCSTGTASIGCGPKPARVSPSCN